ncbi:hypothetical protein AB6A40_011599 [Gnathostoma spinigerum]|uniref:Uncharacterized protein n=1 Tax=Gnathostoma spinigerum TaxID=75299 RepID=A0ABD6EY59_9BILA
MITIWTVIRILDLPVLYQIGFGCFVLSARLSLTHLMEPMESKHVELARQVPPANCLTTVWIHGLLCLSPSSFSLFSVKGNTGGLVVDLLLILILVCSYVHMFLHFPDKTNFCST